MAYVQSTKSFVHLRKRRCVNTNPGAILISTCSRCITPAATYCTVRDHISAGTVISNAVQLLSICVEYDRYEVRYSVYTAAYV